MGSADIHMQAGGMDKGMQMSETDTMVETVGTSTRARAETTTTETMGTTVTETNGWQAQHQDFTQLSARIEEALALQVRGLDG